MDDGGFAQSRGEDDLFDDELIPIDPSEVQVITEQFEETTIQPELPKSPPQKAPSVRGGPNKARGAGRGRGKGNTASHQVPKTEPTATSEPETKDEIAPPALTEDGVQEAKGESDLQPARPQAVRGDRSATGGLKKPKLTEEQLSAKMAEAKARSTTLSEAHARALADAASFEERERVAQQKRKAMQVRDAANRKVMDSEREANRRRKMQAQGIREWDVGKDEEEFSNRGGGRQYMRGAHGGVRYDRSSRAEDTVGDNPDETAPSDWRGRGSGRRGGRGRGGAGRTAGASDRDAPAKGGLASSKYASFDYNAESEFPALPAGLKPKTEPADTTTTTAAAERPAQTGRKVSELGESSGTWAEQVESSVAAK